MKLIKVNFVFLNYKNSCQIIANYIPDFIGREGEYFETLGTYKSKERALEVLDEIQKKIKNEYLLKSKIEMKLNDLQSAKEYFEKMNEIKIITSDENFEILPINSNIIVYEMPEE